MPLRSDGIDRIVQPMLFDPSVSRPYQDLDGTMPMIADVRHIHTSHCPLAVTRALTPDHPYIARRNAARSNTRDPRKPHHS
jgi:hypothetical protein